MYSCLWTRTEAVDLIGQQGHEQTAGGKEGGAGKGARRRFLSRENHKRVSSVPMLRAVVRTLGQRGMGAKLFCEKKVNPCSIMVMRLESTGASRLRSGAMRRKRMPPQRRI